MGQCLLLVEKEMPVIKLGPFQLKLPKMGKNQQPLMLAGVRQNSPTFENTEAVLAGPLVTRQRCWPQRVGL